MYTYIEWDDLKNRRNLHKHGITFSSAAELFNYPHLVRLDLSARKASKKEVALFEQEIKN